jgi:hypothetical protein
MDWMYMESIRTITSSHITLESSRAPSTCVRPVWRDCDTRPTVRKPLRISQHQINSQETSAHIACKTSAHIVTPDQQSGNLCAYRKRCGFTGHPLLHGSAPAEPTEAASSPALWRDGWPQNTPSEPRGAMTSPLAASPSHGFQFLLYKNL